MHVGFGGWNRLCQQATRLSYFALTRNGSLRSSSLGLQSSTSHVHSFGLARQPRSARVSLQNLANRSEKATEAIRIPVRGQAGVKYPLILRQSRGEQGALTEHEGVYGCVHDRSAKEAQRRYPKAMPQNYFAMVSWIFRVIFCACCSISCWSWPSIRRRILGSVPE